VCAVSGDQPDLAVKGSYRQAIDKHWPGTSPIRQFHPEKGRDPNDREIEPLTIGEYL